MRKFYGVKEIESRYKKSSKNVLFADPEKTLKFKNSQLFYSGSRHHKMFWNFYHIFYIYICKLSRNYDENFGS